MSASRNYYTVKAHKLFIKEIKKLPKAKQKRIKNIIRSIKQNPTDLPSNTSPMKGKKGVFRTRIGSYRLIYYIVHDSREIVLLGVGSRGSVYQLIERIIT